MRDEIAAVIDQHALLAGAFTVCSRERGASERTPPRRLRRRRERG